MVHAGWRGIRQGILESLLAHARHRGISPEDLVVVTGPGIRGCHYPVGPEFDAYFPEAIQWRGRQRYVDLFRVVKKRLHRAGVQEIVDPPYCTFEHPLWFFSYRRDPRNRGRMWMVVRFKD